MKLVTLKPRIKQLNASRLQRSGKAHSYDSFRGNSNDRGYGHRWRKARERYLFKNPCCVECEREGFVEPAKEVDHIKPHRGDQVLFWDESNWQSLCKRHHSAKTARGE